MGYKRMTPEKRRELGRQRTTELAALLHSGYQVMGRRQVWADVMRAGAVHLSRGPVNAIAIGLQDPEATQVLSYGKWQEAGRQVRRGENGIRIWGPMSGRSREAGAEQPEPSTGEQLQAGDEPQARGWVSNAVFDISQTDGEPVPAQPGAATAAQVVRNRLIATLTGQGDHRAFLIAGVPAEAIDPEDAARSLLMKTARRNVEAFGMCPTEQVEAEAAAAAHVAAHILGIPPGPLLAPPAAGWITDDPHNPPVKTSAVRAIELGRVLAELVGEACPCCNGVRHEQDHAEV
ncbi:hypothetical protein [Streptomyces sp. MJM1172]|uniref:hypothetical protein n=1 Tax=Streptomyces sp. MJM1172 TaxID=1703926 RepID=UPI00093C5ADE|nr:hypothetical protein [Streptomyces sp. MJM1172]OKI45752.1 hypothetical protein AMK15_36095 [Streptomyces sp. MJM1172]